jgi:hypothetical protein
LYNFKYVGTPVLHPQVDEEADEEEDGDDEQRRDQLEIDLRDPAQVTLGLGTVRDTDLAVVGVIK